METCSIIDENAIGSLGNNISAVLGLVGLFKSSVDARKAKDLDAYLDWLRRHEHEQLVTLIQDNTAIGTAIKHIIVDQQDSVMAELKQLNGMIAALAANFSSTAQLANANTEIRLSAQAKSILRLMHTKNVFGLVVNKAFNDHCVHLNGSAYDEIDIKEGHYLLEDMDILCALGIFRVESTNGTDHWCFALTRDGAEISRRISAESVHQKPV